MKTNICIIGAGNISNTRHIPALKKISDAVLYGVLSNKRERAQKTADTHNISNYGIIYDDVEANVEMLQQLDWFNNVDAVVIGAPPHLHYPLTKASLLCGKHVLVEKPMMMNKEECDELIALAAQQGKVFYVMHNFQYASKMLKLNDIIASGKYGDIENITEVQFTNHDRRLPEWYNDLPMGLFYDEAAHFVYLLERHGGELTIENSYAFYDDDPNAQTPKTLTVSAKAGNVPVNMMLNFHSPVCEWHYIVSFKKQIFIYDFFKDILISLPTDNEHRAKDILLNSIRHTWQYWTQFIGNGFKMVTGNLLYGHDVVLQRFIDTIGGSAPDPHLTAENGRKNTVSINDIVTKANQR